MERIIGGYTIIEVMIFLAISSLLFVSAVIAVGGQQAHTEFSTSMRDMNSKMQDWINQVIAGFSGSESASGASTYSCGYDPLGYPVLNTTTTTERGANPECIFIGKAVQVNTSPPFNESIAVYTVLGRRTVAVSGELVGNLRDAQPAPASFDKGGLAESYPIQNGARFKCVMKADGTDCEPNGSRMAGFFLSLNTQQNTSQTGSQSLNLYQYSLYKDVDPRTPPIENCIKLTGPDCFVPPAPASPLSPLSKWRLCFVSTRNSDTAVLSVTSASGIGAAVNLAFDPC